VIRGWERRGERTHCLSATAGLSFHTGGAGATAGASSSPTPNPDSNPSFITGRR